MDLDHSLSLTSEHSPISYFDYQLQGITFGVRQRGVTQLIENYLHMHDLGSIPGTLHGPLNPTKSNPERRAMSEP